MTFKGKIMAKKEKVKVEFDESIHGDKLKSLIKDVSDNMIIIDGYKEKIKESRDAAKEELGVEAKMFNQLVKIYYKDAREVFEEQNDEILECYDSIFS